MNNNEIAPNMQVIIAANCNESLRRFKKVKLLSHDTIRMIPRTMYNPKVMEKIAQTERK